MIITADDPESQAYRESVQQLARELRTTEQAELHESFLNIGEWVVGLRIFLDRALNRRVDVTGEVLSTRFVIHIRIPNEDRILCLDHTIDYVVLRKVRMDQQSLIKTEGAMLFHKLKAFFDGENLHG